MTRLEEVARLKELEKKAMPGPWYYRETSISRPVDAQYFSNMRIGSDADNSRTGRVYLADAGEWADLNITVDLRNAAPWLLEAAACFQPGDVRCLKAIMGIMRAATGPETDSDELDCLRRLQKAAEIMEGME